MKKRKIAISVITSVVMLLSSCSGNNAVNTTTENEITTTVSTTATSESEKSAETTTEAEQKTETEAITESDTTEITTTEPATTEATTTEASTAVETTTTTATEAAATTSETEETTVETEKKYIALTFDDGPNTTTTNEVLDVLEQYGIKGSFFLIGNNINDESAKSVKRAYDMGCDIGNHSKSHPYMNELSVEEINEEIDYVSERIVEITGEAPKFFRPPYIAINNTMYDAIDLTFISGFGCNDWDDKVTAERRAKIIIRQAQDGGIILLHDAQGNSKTVEALHTIIPELQAQGYEFVTLTELFEIKGVKLSADDGNLYSFVGQ